MQDQEKAGPKKIALEYPIEGEHGPIAEVTLRRLRAGHFVEMEKAGADGEAAATIAMVAAVTGLTREQVAELDADDFITLTETATDFLGQKASGLITSKNGAA